MHECIAALGSNLRNSINPTTKRALNDYYSFTTQIIERVYSPSLNELLNVERELHILLKYKVQVGLNKGLSEGAQGMLQLECVPPEPPVEPEPGKEPEIRKKEPWCPFKKPITLRVLVVELEFDCEKAKIEAGEGLIGSFERDFKKHETTLFLGAGADVDVGVFGAGAKVGVKVQFDEWGTVQDVGMSSEVESQLGGTITGTVIKTKVEGDLWLGGAPSSIGAKTDMGIKWGGDLELKGQFD